MKISAITLVSCTLALSSFVSPQATTDWIIPAGTSATYDTVNGPLVLGRFELGTGAILRVQGTAPFRLEANSIHIDGVLDASGFAALNVFTLNTANVPELGAAGGPGGGRGGIGSLNTAAQTFSGETGHGPRDQALAGGFGGEGGWNSNQALSGSFRRAAGGGGGRFGPAELVIPSHPEDPANSGLIALPGVAGAEQATGSLFGYLGPIPGGPGPLVFVDGLVDNDFFGVKPGTPPVQGELAAPRAGQGGGAGGDAFYLPGGQFPPTSFVVNHTDKGAGGGGGGGLVILQSKRFRMGANGRILSNGGHGATGENTAGFNNIGGGSGAGSGGMILIQSILIDLSSATPDSLQAIGGHGGFGANNTYRATGAGGHGGPGLIQLHPTGPQTQSLLLPAGLALSDLSQPAAHRLLPVSL